MDIIWHKQIVCFLITTKHFPWFLPHWLTPRTKGRANFWRAQKQTWPPHESAKTPTDRLWRLEKIIRNVVCVFMSWRQSSKWANEQMSSRWSKNQTIGAGPTQSIKRAAKSRKSISNFAGKHLRARRRTLRGGSFCSHHSEFKDRGNNRVPCFLSLLQIRRD